MKDEGLHLHGKLSLPQLFFQVFVQLLNYLLVVEVDPVPPAKLKTEIFPTIVDS